MRITDRIEYFEEPIKSDEELFSKLNPNTDYIVVTRFVHSEEELWDAGLLTYDKLYWYTEGLLIDTKNIDEVMEYATNAWKQKAIGNKVV